MDHLMPACAFYPGSGRTVIPTVLPPSDGSEVSRLKFFVMRFLIRSVIHVKMFLCLVNSFQYIFFLDLTLFLF
jgi:hypothetical protein